MEFTKKIPMAKWIIILAVLFSPILPPTIPAQPGVDFKTLAEFKRSQLRTFEIRATAVAIPDHVRLGDILRIQIQVSISSGAHIYSLKEKEEGESLATRLSLKKTPFFQTGKWKESPPQMAMDRVLQKMLRVHTHNVDFYQDLIVPDNLEPGIFPIQGVLNYRVCNNKVCTLPQELDFQTLVRVVGTK